MNGYDVEDMKKNFDQGFFWGFVASGVSTAAVMYVGFRLFDVCFGIS